MKGIAPVTTTGPGLTGLTGSHRRPRGAERQRDSRRRKVGYATKKLLGCAAAAGALLVLSPSAYGQASEAEMRAFPMPPPSGFAQTKHFG